MSTTVLVPPDARFTCAGCGRCCQGWSVPVDAATVARLRAHDWGAEPFEATRSGGEPYRTRLVNGRCFFLDADNKCRIHAELSYEAKPVACRLFPLSVLNVEGRQHARLSYWCPTVVANVGKPLSQQQRWLRDGAKHADERTAGRMLNTTLEVSRVELDALHETLRNVLSARAFPFTDRFAAMAALVRRVDLAGTRGGSGAVRQALASTRLEVVPELAAEIHAAGHASTGRRVLTLFLLQDRAEGRVAALRRLAAVITFRAGIARLHSKAIAAAASRAQIRRVAFDIDDQSEALLVRYFGSKLEGRRYLAGDATVVEGWNTIVAAYGLLSLLARMRAGAAARVTCNEEDIRAAVSAADLLVLEHSGLPRGRVHRQLVRNALGNSDAAADILAAATTG